MSSVLITGASSGIGKELVGLFAERKYNLFLLARNTEKLKKIKEKVEENYQVACEIISYDLSETKGLEKIVSDYDYDVLINCAGFGEIINFDKMPLDKDLQMLNVNLVSPLILTKLFIEKSLVKNKGVVINICSTAALYKHPYMVVYSTSKAGLLNYSLSLSEEIKHRNKNINIISICPGPTDTNFFEETTKEKFGIFKLWEMSTEKVAKDIIKVFDKKKKFAIIGLRNIILIKLTAILPIKLQLKIVAHHLRKGAK